ncbi:hypothetical protein PO909_006367 [Leuciscus waleckii]
MDSWTDGWMDAHTSSCLVSMQDDDRRTHERNTLEYQRWRTVVFISTRSRTIMPTEPENIYCMEIEQVQEIMDSWTDGWMDAHTSSCLVSMQDDDRRTHERNTLEYQRWRTVISDYLDNLKIKTRSVCLHQRSFLNPSSLP